MTVINEEIEIREFTEDNEKEIEPVKDEKPVIEDKKKSNGPKPLPPPGDKFYDTFLASSAREALENG